MDLGKMDRGKEVVSDLTSHAPAAGTQPRTTGQTGGYGRTPHRSTMGLTTWGDMGENMAGATVALRQSWMLNGEFHAIR